MNTFTDTIDTRVPANIRKILASDSSIAAFFGVSSIRLFEYLDLAGPTRAPFLAIIPGLVDDQPQTANYAKAFYPIDVAAFLPRQAPADGSLTVPAAPTSAAGASGLLSVTRAHCVTFYTATGESYASNLSTPLTVSAKKITVTIPTGPAGTVGRRIWATDSGRTCARFLDVVADNTTTSYTDNTPDVQLGDEIAPDPLGYRKIFGYIKRVLRQYQVVPDNVAGTGYEIADALVRTKDAEPRVDGQRNQLVWSIRATYEIPYYMDTRQSIVEP